MLLRITVDEVIKAIGHDGSEVVLTESTGSKKYKGFHPQELIDIALHHDVALVEIVAIPGIMEDGWQRPVPVYADSEKRILSYMEGHVGLVEVRSDSKNLHMVYWDGSYLYDPKDGQMKTLDGFMLESFYLALRIKSLAKN